MRRRSDSWINATQILKVADFDKPQRTRILEREVQRGVHEKVQGGYGKYQGTWVPLDRARAIANQYNVEELLMPIFNFRPSTESPPLAPKHITAASTKPRPARAAGRPALVKRASSKLSTGKPGPGRRPKSQFVAELPPPPPPPPVLQAPPSEDSFDDGVDGDVMSEMDPLDDPSAASLASSSASENGFEDVDIADHPSQHSAGMTLKRKRSEMEHDPLAMYELSSPHQHHHHHHGGHHGGHPHDSRRISYSDELLDYFMTKDIEVPEFLNNPPPDFDVNEIIDTEGHTAIHWAAAMGDLKVIDLLVRAKANIFATNKRGETPLMRAVLFTNNHDRKSFPRLVETLRGTIFLHDKFHSTVFHHIAATTSSRNKLLAARFYDEVLLQKLSEAHTIDEIAHFLNAKDMHGDTALTISARNDAKKCVRTLLGYTASADIPNNRGETADRLIMASEERRQAPHRCSSSSPFTGTHDPPLNPSLPPYLPHTSEAAIAATKKVIPLMAEMLEGLATAFDRELQDKEEDHQQAHQLLAASTAEIEAVRMAAHEALLPYDGDDAVLAADSARLQAEAAALAEELRATLERNQGFELSQWIHTEELAEQSTDGEVTEAELLERMSAARALAAAQSDRQALMDTIVRAFARSGAGGKMGDYRRLIALSCGLLPDDVEKLLPEILKDLEAGGAVVQEGEMGGVGGGQMGWDVVG
ncbi:hypothetical protein EDC01DRAFT_717384 [Geopyxis carbonaria]|nr:hypothetical protein EDC01DRAFT_717384 [Geopyxis carbonaria]